MLQGESGYVTFLQVMGNYILVRLILFCDRMEYPRFVEVCGNCGSLITWDAEGRAICKCGTSKLQFMPEEDAIELGILEEE